MTKVIHIHNKNILKNRLTPIIKWAGGKEQELKYIHSSMPKIFKNFYEPFVGGGATFLSLEAQKIFINDKSEELIDLYNVIKNQDTIFFNNIRNFALVWDLLKEISINNREEIILIYQDFSKDNIEELSIKKWIKNFIQRNLDVFHKVINLTLDIKVEIFLKELEKNLISKIKRMKKIEIEKGVLSNDHILDNIETAIKSAYYMYCRYLHNNIEKYKINNPIKTAIFFFIRNFAYSGMFRYNNNGDFNVPYGGIGYNSRNLIKKIDYLQSENLLNHLKNVCISNLDFEAFLNSNKPTKDDFIFLDPPYDSEFSTYAKNEFTRNDQTRLANYLINDCKAKWLMIIKNTDFIFDLYNKSNINIYDFEKKYLVSFQNRNIKDVKHLLIRNYYE